MKQNNILTFLRGVVVGFIVCFTSLSLPASEEEFVGPFASWRDLRRDYGAVGDGKTDDNKALQRALDELTKHEKACVLYIPAGTYRLTATVQTKRKEHSDCQGVAVIGEDPSSTILLKLRAFVEGLAGSESTQVAPPVHDDVSGSLNKP
jgi:hypothetical protein